MNRAGRILSLGFVDRKMVIYHFNMSANFLAGLSCVVDNGSMLNSCIVDNVLSSALEFFNAINCGHIDKTLEGSFASVSRYSPHNQVFFQLTHKQLFDIHAVYNSQKYTAYYMQHISTVGVE